jgi:hypothetical protein
MANQINNLTKWPNQLTHVVIEDGTIADFSFKFNGATQKWVFGVDHSLLHVHNMSLNTHFNILRQWMNKIPFGLCVVSADGLDPMLVDDFVSGRITLWVLTSDNVQQMEKMIRAARTP